LAIPPRSRIISRNKDKEDVMTKRILLAGILGGIAMFLWSFVAHDVLPLGTAGISEMPNEAAVLGSMNASLGQSSGLYIFPGFGLGSNATRQQKASAMKDYEKKLASNPSGILIYHPAGGSSLTPARLGTEFVTELIEAFLLVFLLAQTRLVSFGSRVGFVAVAGLLAAIATNIPYWNWYGFPLTYTLSSITMQFVSFLMVGIVAAAILKQGTARTSAAAA
jgi:hypothetical protein